VPRKRSNSKSAYVNPKERLTTALESAVNNHGLPPQSSTALKSFITNGCFPLPVEIENALDSIKSALMKLRNFHGRTIDARQFRRFEDAGKCLKHLKNLITLLSSIGIGPLLASKNPAGKISRPIFISLDLGLRQRRANYNGQTFFQCVALKDDYFENLYNDGGEPETNDSIVSSTGLGLRIAEGGRYGKGY
jgi:hypothetical protein